MMAQNYFTSEHFKLLNKWKDIGYDKTNPEQQRVYADLKQAYEITGAWAKALQETIFPGGRISVHRSPINAGQKYHGYNWARIYPRSDSPIALAFTVGISAQRGFFVNIDTVGLGGKPARKIYENLRGTDENNSPFVAQLTVEEGLNLSFSQLVEWSAAAISKFRIGYDDLARRLGLAFGLESAALLARFSRNLDFKKFQPEWGQEKTALFVRFANAINQMGMDWWFTKATNSQLRFGRKEKGKFKGSPIGWFFLRESGIYVHWDAFADLPERKRTEISEEVVQSVEEASFDEGLWPAKLGPRLERIGYWPDELGESDPADEGDPVMVDAAQPYDKTIQPVNQIYYGPPGTGKTYRLQELLRQEHDDNDEVKRFEFVTFHQSYGYEEFIEGLRPVLAKNQKADQPITDDGQVHYEIVPGAFLRLCERARKDKSHKYVMFIDEINRGNISKIFGELITLLETDKRDGGQNRLEITLPYSQKPFSVPWNVDVIGSMNTADRSLAVIDTALRRRFDFIETMPDPNELKDVFVESGGVKIDIKQMLETINDRIEVLYDREHTIGHAYFMVLKNATLPADPFGTLRNIFKNRIIPLLEEYFFDDWHKIRLVLADNQKNSQPKRQFIQESAKYKELHALFGKDDALDQYQLATRYQRNEGALEDPWSYVGIYDPQAASTK